MGINKFKNNCYVRLQQGIKRRQGQQFFQYYPSGSKPDTIEYFVLRNATSFLAKLVVMR